MNLKNLTPKDRQLYEIAMERKEELKKLLYKRLRFSELGEVLEVIHHISRAEYKRGKADGMVEE